MTHRECVIATLLAHRQGMQWTDEAVADAVLARLGVDPFAEVGSLAVPAAVVVEPELAPVVVEPEAGPMAVAEPELVVESAPADEHRSDFIPPPPDADGLS